MSLRASLLCIALCALAACAGVLGIRQGPQRAFEHRAHVEEGVACVKCHGGIELSGAEDPLQLPENDSCLSCHTEPHDARACNGCHGLAEHRHALAEAKAHLVYSHALHQGPSLGQCMRCHVGVLSPQAPLRPTMATCLGCHEHRQQWAKRSCLPCHRDLEGEQVRPQSHVIHGPDFMARHGVAAASSADLCSTCHDDSDCAQCHGLHVPALPQVLHFDQPSRPDMHPRGFASRHAIEARIDPQTCLSCHRDERACVDCHARRGVLQRGGVARSPHPPGFAGRPHGVAARQNPVECASCHGGAGEQLCVDCHRVGGPGGNPHPPGFSSRKSFDERPCRLCHTGGP